MSKPKREPIFNWSLDALVITPIAFVVAIFVLLWLAGIIVPVALWVLSPVLYLPHLLLQP